jgi:flagellar protein FlaF
MGFSVSGSAVIVFIGFVVAVGIAVPSVLGSVGELAGAQGEQIDRGTDRANTDVEINRTVYNETTGLLAIELDNTGSTTLSVNDTSVLVNGTIRTRSGGGIVETAVDGDTGATIWLPAEQLEVTVDAADAPGRVKIVTENGIEVTTTDIETVS